VRFGFVAKHSGIWPVWRCEALGVSRSGFYAWRERPWSLRPSRVPSSVTKCARAFVLSDHTYGARRVLPDVRAAGHACGLHRIERLMKAQGPARSPRAQSLAHGSW
jgi:putative transposase